MVSQVEDCIEHQIMQGNPIVGFGADMIREIFSCPFASENHKSKTWF
jgi:hypothetical protein